MFIETEFVAALKYDVPLNARRKQDEGQGGALLSFQMHVL